MDKKDEDEIKAAIIHGRTPNAGWFKKGGKSANPSGRPKKRKPKMATDTSFRDEFLKLAEALMKLTENGNEIQIPVHSAIAKSEILAAFKGSSHAQRNFLTRYERFRRERAEEIEKDHEEWRQYVVVYDKIVEGFRLRGEPLPNYYPHPDELHFPTGRKVTGWLGQDPYEGAVLRAHYVKVRDIYLLQSEKDRRYWGSKNDLENGSGGLVLFINALLPNSAQLDVVGLTVRLGQQHVLPKRELQQRLTAGWAEIGFPEGKTLITPPIDPAIQIRLLRSVAERTLGKIDGGENVVDQ